MILDQVSKYIEAVKHSLSEHKLNQYYPKHQYDELYQIFCKNQQQVETDQSSFKL
jgi:hypothetical protein